MIKEAGIDFTYINWSDEPVYATVGAKLTTSYGSHTCTTYAITANGEAPLPGSSYYPPNFGTWDVSKYTVVNEIGTVLLLPGENTIRIAADTVSAYGMNIGEVYLQMDEHTAAEVDDLIEAIGDVTLGSKEAIETARAAYEALSDARKALVTKLEVLEAAEAAYAAAVKDEEERTVAAAAAVDTLILSIGEVTLDSKSTIEAARTAYEVLTDASKALVTRLTDLEAAEAAFADLKAAAAVDALIAAMVVEDEASVKAARKAYDALTDEQKALVTNLAKLEEAELYWNTVNNVVSLVLTGKDAVDAIDGEVVYTLSARGMTNLASVAVSIAIPEEYLAEPVAAAAEGWMIVAQARKDGKLHVVIVNTEGANGDGDILTVTAKPMETNGMATLTVTAVEMGAYLGEKETFVQADLTEATVTTEIRSNPCDVNKDGVVDIRDISRAQRYYGGSFADADVNRDGTVDVADLIMILNHYTDLFQ